MARTLGVAALAASLLPLTLTVLLANQEVVEVVPVNGTFEYVSFDIEFLGVGGTVGARQILAMSLLVTVVLVIIGVYLGFFFARNADRDDVDAINRTDV